MLPSPIHPSVRRNSNNIISAAIPDHKVRSQRIDDRRRDRRSTTPWEGMLSGVAGSRKRVLGDGRIAQVSPRNVGQRWQDCPSAPVRNLGYGRAHLGNPANVARRFWGTLGQSCHPPEPACGILPPRKACLPMGWLNVGHVVDRRFAVI